MRTDAKLTAALFPPPVQDGAGLSAIARQIDELHSRPEGRRLIRRALTRWGANLPDPDPIDGRKFLPQRHLSLDECVLVLAAVHDAIAVDAPPISPWPCWRTTAQRDAAIAFQVLVSRVPASPSDDEVARIQEALDRVHGELEGPVSPTTGETSVAKPSEVLNEGVSQAQALAQADVARAEVDTSTLPVDPHAGELGTTASDEPDDSPPALTQRQADVLWTMARFDGSRLLSASAVVDEMHATKRLSEETVRQCVLRLIDAGLAERPEGRRSGARLTIAGRRLAGKIAD